MLRLPVFTSLSGCNTTNLCPIGDESLRETYQNTVGGFAVAFMAAYAQVSLVVLVNLRTKQTRRNNLYAMFTGKHGSTYLPHTS